MTFQIVKKYFESHEIIFEIIIISRIVLKPVINVTRHVYTFLDYPEVLSTQIVLKTGVFNALTPFCSTNWRYKLLLLTGSESASKKLSEYQKTF